MSPAMNDARIRMWGTLSVLHGEAAIAETRVRTLREELKRAEAAFIESKADVEALRLVMVGDDEPANSGRPSPQEAP